MKTRIAKSNASQFRSKLGVPRLLQIQRPFSRLKAFLGLGIFILLLLASPMPTVEARSAFSPWEFDQGLQNLVYGATTGADLVRIMGEPPDDIVRDEQMYPLIENHYYFDEGGTGAATVFVFQNNFLVGLLYKSPSNQFVDLTSFLPNNGDSRINNQIMGGFRGFFPNYPVYW